MTRDEAKALLERLRVAYPRLALPVDTVAFWLAELQPVEAEVGAEVVDGLIHSVTFFPSIAEFTAELSVVRERRGQKAREEQRRQAIEAEQAMAPLPKEIVKEMRSLVARLGHNPEPGLEEVAPGECDDCRQEAKPRFRYVGLKLCSKCGALRAGAAGNLYRSNVDLAKRWVESEGFKRTDAQVASRLKEMLPGEAYSDPRIVLEDLAADLRNEAAA